ncbi:hypothetical protein ABBQ38_005828 [Trebouxia sp. C0009 RCD-2024]
MTFCHERLTTPDDKTVAHSGWQLLQKLSGPGLSAAINLPQLEALHAHDTFELDFELSCPGHRDKDCPIWDHTVQLFVCGDDSSGHAPPCEPCDPTVWSEPYSASSSHHGANWTGSAREWLQRSSSSAADAAAVPQCGRELGRWITPFRRRIGRWLTDVTPLLPLLTSQKCHFHLQTAPWALTWTPSLTLRFTNSTPSSPLAPGSGTQTPQSTGHHPQPLHLPADGDSMQSQSQTLQSHSTHEPLSLSLGNTSSNDSLTQQSYLQPETAFEPVEAKLKPHSIIPLFDGGDFDAEYNSKFKPVEFEMPHGTQKALLEAVVTGHGYDNNQCAEFCITSHHFLVNGKEHLLNFTEAGKPWGCADQVLQGSEPNEHGTWQYGRGGWCDGQEVRPWVVDITQDLAAGHMNAVTYHGLYQGHSPKPEGQAGFIMMQSNVIFYT